MNWALSVQRFLGHMDLTNSNPQPVDAALVPRFGASAALSITGVAGPGGM